MPVLSRTKKTPALIDSSEYKRESDIPYGGTDSAVDYCQALDWTDSVCIVVLVRIVVSCVYCCFLCVLLSSYVYLLYHVRIVVSCVYCCFLCVLLLVVLCVLLSSYVYSLYHVCIAVFTLDAGLLARSQHSEGPSTGHLDTGFSCFPCL
jgi:hypothetical protein